MSHRCDGCANAATCKAKRAAGVMWCREYWPKGVERESVKTMGRHWEEDEDDAEV